MKILPYRLPHPQRTLPFTTRVPRPNKTTGLMWMRCSLGQTWSGSACADSATLFAWADVPAVAVGSNFAGYSDWRLPNRNELGSIVERRCYSPSINPVVFPNTQYLNAFWSSSPSANDGSGVWATYFAFGANAPFSKLSGHHVRLVRSGN